MKDNLNQFKSTSVLDYKDPNLFLSDRWNEMRAKNPNLSIRAFARILQLGSHTPLHLMILGKRNISKKYSSILIKYFEFSAFETKHFENLVQASRLIRRVDVNKRYMSSIKDMNAYYLEDPAFNKMNTEG